MPLNLLPTTKLERKGLHYPSFLCSVEAAGVKQFLRSPLCTCRVLLGRNISQHQQVMRRTLIGHADGSVSRYDTSGPPGTAVEQRYAWAAFRGGAVTALCTTDFGDLWCANARGNIRCRHAAVLVMVCMNHV